MIVCPKCGHGFDLPKGRNPLTPRQVELLDFIEKYREDHRCGPSYQEIADAFGFQSLATVAEHMENLQRKGYITKEYNETRSLMVHR